MDLQWWRSFAENPGMHSTTAVGEGSSAEAFMLHDLQQPTELKMTIIYAKAKAAPAP